MRPQCAPPSDSEITNVKNYLVGRFPLQIETADQTIRQRQEELAAQIIQQGMHGVAAALNFVAA